MYELAKVSLNNVGNEIRSSERRSNDAKTVGEEEKENYIPEQIFINKPPNFDHN